MCMARNFYSTSKYKWIWRIMENSKPEKDNMKGNIPSCIQLGPSGRSNRGWRRPAIPGRENSKRLSRSRARLPGRLAVLVADLVMRGTQQCSQMSSAVTLVSGRHPCEQNCGCSIAAWKVRAQHGMLHQCTKLWHTEDTASVEVLQRGRVSVRRRWGLEIQIRWLLGAQSLSGPVGVPL